MTTKTTAATAATAAATMSRRARAMRRSPAARSARRDSLLAGISQNNDARARSRLVLAPHALIIASGRRERAHSFSYCRLPWRVELNCASLLRAVGIGGDLLFQLGASIAPRVLRLLERSPPLSAGPQRARIIEPVKATRALTCVRHTTLDDGEDNRRRCRNSSSSPNRRLDRRFTSLRLSVKAAAADDRLCRSRAAAASVERLTRLDEPPVSLAIRLVDGQGDQQQRQQWLSPVEEAARRAFASIRRVSACEQP